MEGPVLACHAPAEAEASLRPQGQAGSNGSNADPGQDGAGDNRKLRRPDRRSRDIRGRRRLSPQRPASRYELRRARSARWLRRHVVDASLSRHPFRQRPLYVRLSLQAVDERTRGHQGRDSQVHGRGDRRERSRPAHPIQPQDHLREVVERGEPVDDRSHTDGHRPGATVHREFPLDVPGLLPPCGGLYARMAGHRRVPGPDRASPNLAGGPRVRRQERRSDRLGRHSRHPCAGDRGRLLPSHAAAALAHLLHPRP